MPRQADDVQLAFYTCGKCKGEIRYLKSKGPPDVCPECGYSYAVHGLRDVNDIPSVIRLNLNDL